MAAPTQSSRFWTTGGAGDGASTYTRDQLAEVFRNAFLSDATTQGVFSGLAVSGTASPLTIATGASCVYGYLHFITAAGDMTIATPAVGTTGWHIVLRADWTAQTVRAVAVRNTDGVSAVPSPTQTAGTTWEIRVASGTITTGGVIAVTDARSFCHFATRIDRNNVDGGGATAIPFYDANGRLTDGIELSYTDSSNSLAVLSSGGDPRLVLGDSGAAGGFGYVQWDSTTDEMRIGTQTGGATVRVSEGGQVTLNPASATAPIVLGANGQGQTVDGLAADEIDTLSFRRQGGSATDWSSGGATNRTETTMRVQAGCTRIAGPVINTGSGLNTVTFPVVFSNKPLVFVSYLGSQYGITAAVQSPTASTIDIYIYNYSGSSQSNIDVQWLALGPE